MDIKIEFFPETHEYLVDGEKAKISVTALVDKQISKTEWFAIDPAVLKRAADRGTDVHADLEYFVGKGTKPRTQECKNFAQYIKDNNWTIENPLTEFKLAIRHEIVFNNRKYTLLLTGTADLICKLNGKYVIVDHKTTSTVHEEYVRWQMSLLDYMARQLNGHSINGVPFEYHDAEEMYVFWFNKQAEFKPVKVEKISDIEIVRLLDAEARNEEYHPTIHDILTPRQRQSLDEIERKLATLEVAKSLLLKEEDKLKTEMLQAFAVHTDVKKVEFGSVTVTYKSPTTRETFDSKRFQEEHPDLYKQYLTTSNVKGSVSISLSKEVKEYVEARSTEIPLIAPPKPVARKNTKKGFLK